MRKNKCKELSQRTVEMKTYIEFNNFLIKKRKANGNIWMKKENGNLPIANTFPSPCDCAIEEVQLSL